MRRPPGDIRISPADLEVEYQARLEAERERDRYREALELIAADQEEHPGQHTVIARQALADQEQER